MQPSKDLKLFLVAAALACAAAPALAAGSTAPGMSVTNNRAVSSMFN
ncbi:hypothetical protein [Variovorax sp. J22R115]|nr:hypothetical protein [Variovorax sp. J22R115]MDM0049929.1 hypothetical protein [Variovorax sp. J22R115]